MKCFVLQLDEFDQHQITKPQREKSNKLLISYISHILGNTYLTPSCSQWRNYQGSGAGMGPPFTLWAPIASPHLTCVMWWGEYAMPSSWPPRPPPPRLPPPPNKDSVTPLRVVNTGFINSTNDETCENVHSKLLI